MKAVLIEQLKRSGLKRAELNSGLTQAALACMAMVILGIPIVLSFGSLWMLNETIDVGTFVVFSVFVLRVYQPSLDRIAAVFDVPVQVAPKSVLIGVVDVRDLTNVQLFDCLA